LIGARGIGCARHRLRAASAARGIGCARYRLRAVSAARLTSEQREHRAIN
jgi:hypothetical protein